MNVQASIVATYPDVDPEELLRAARQYRAAAETLLATDGATAPCRFLAAHAVELFLSAFLVAKGIPPVAVRRMGHDVGARVDEAIKYGLTLRKKTEGHIRALSLGREYLFARYAPRLISQVPANRIGATLKQLDERVGAALA